MPKEITLRQLRYFVAAAETGQFSMAASREHVSQSAITNAVLMLEQTLGVRLFERRPHGVELTAEGHSFCQHSRHVLDSLQDAVREPGFLSHTLGGAIHIAASYTVLGYFLPALMARFRRNYPDIEIDLQDLERAQIEQALEAEEIELGIVILSNRPDRSTLEEHVLIRSRRQLWMASDHPLASIPFPSLNDIAPYTYIQLNVDEGEESTLRYWQSQGLNPNTGFRTGSLEALRGLIAHGFGITILSDMVYRPWSLEGKKIEARPITDAVPHMEVGLIWKPGVKLSEQADAFRQFLIHACGS